MLGSRDFEVIVAIHAAECDERSEAGWPYVDWSSILRGCPQVAVHACSTCESADCSLK